MTPDWMTAEVKHCGARILRFMRPITESLEAWQDEKGIQYLFDVKNKKCLNAVRDVR